MKLSQLSKHKINNRGFSLVELVVIIAVLVVLLAILAPFLLRYVENSRIQKDESSMDELCGAIKLAMSDAEVLDEVWSYAIPHNYTTYTDSSNVYGAKYTDEEFWAPDGYGLGVTITFNPNEDRTYILADGWVNKIEQDNGSIGTTRVIAEDKQTKFSEMGQAKLYTKVQQLLGQTLREHSATYSGSSYTVFISLNNISGMKTTDIYGEWNGTNLSPESPAAIIEGTTTPEQPETPTEPTTPPAPEHSGSDLEGGGGTSVPETPQEPPFTPNHNNTIPEGGIYYVGVTTTDTGNYSTATAVYQPGEAFPRISNGDIYVYGDYEYRYNMRYNLGVFTGESWTTISTSSSTRNSWGVRVRNSTQQTYGPILTQINAKTVKDGSYMFVKCANLITTPSLPDTIIDTAYLCYQCPSLTTITNIPQNTVSLAGAFVGCTSLINPPALSHCTNLKNCSNIFYNCSSLRTAPVFPSTITSLSNGFRNCTSLTGNNIVIPATCNDLQSVFQGCTALTGTITIYPTNPTYINMSFSGVDFAAQNLQLLGVDSTLDRLGGTGTNYCATCNGKCSGSH